MGKNKNTRGFLKFEFYFMNIEINKICQSK